MNKPPDRRPEQQVQQHREPGSALDQRPDGGVPDQPDAQRPVDAACAELDAAQADAAALPARVRLGDLAPDMMRLEAETKQITHAIRMAAYPAVSSRPERTRRSRQGGPSTGKPG